MGRPVDPGASPTSSAAIPSDLALDVLADDRLSVDIVIHCMDEPDVEAIMRVPWIAVCTDAEGRRPGHPILGEGVPASRGPTARRRACSASTSGRAGVIGLETAVAKLSAVPAARVGLRDRGVLREGAYADVVVFDPATVADLATYERPAVHPAGIRDVIVNGRPAVLDGGETGERPGRLLRRGADDAVAVPAAGDVETDAVARLPGGDLPLRRCAGRPGRAGCG